MENFNIRRRSAIRHDYTRTPNVLLFGYRGVSDGAKLTYQVIDALDWTDEQGTRKGFAYPTLTRLATLRGTTERTVRRHLQELEAAELVSRRERPGCASVLVIQDPASSQRPEHLHTPAGDPEGDETDGRDDDDFSRTPDVVVRPPRTFLSAPSTQEVKIQEVKDNVEEAFVEQRRGAPAEEVHIGGILQRRRTWLEQRRMLPANAQTETIADELVAKLGDAKSRGFYLTLARTVPATVLYEAVGQVRETWREGRLRTSRGALFTHCIQEWQRTSSAKRGAA